jgi:hypothetical protein
MTPKILEILTRLDKDLNELRHHVASTLDLMQQELIDLIGDINVYETPRVNEWHDTTMTLETLVEDYRQGNCDARQLCSNILEIAKEIRR